MMAAETSIDVRVLSGLGIENCELAIGSLQREDFGRRMAGAFLAKIGIIRVAKSCRKPNAAFAIDHAVMIVRLGIPELLAAPVRRRLHEFVARRMPGPERLRNIVIAHRRDDD